MSFNNFSVYDCRGSDGHENKKAFQKLPIPMQLVVKQTQAKIMQEIINRNQGREIRKTSGFRSPLVNRKYNGSDYSHHLCGFAIDLAFIPGDPKPFILPDYLFEVIHDKGSGMHRHIGYRAGGSA